MPRVRESIKYRGRRYPVIDTISVRGRRLFVLRKTSHSARNRYQVWAPFLGPSGQMCALWVLPKRCAPRRTIELLSHVSHENSHVPTILDCGYARGSRYVLCKWIDGPTLQAYLRNVRKGKQPWPSTYLTCQMFRGLVFGLRQLNQRAGIVHGDISPGNLVVSRRPLQLVIIDFGSAWGIEQPDSPGSDGLHPVYAAPERFNENTPADFRSDIFSAGVIFYEMLTGEIPYDRLGGRASLVAQQVPKLLPASRVLKASVEYFPIAAKQTIDRIVEKSLQLEPHRRYASYPELLADCSRLRHRLESPKYPHSMMQFLRDWLDPWIT